MELHEKVVVLYANPIDMVDDNDKPLKGVSVSYLMGESFKPVQHPDGHLGQRPAKRFFPLDFWQSGQLVDVPGMYDGTFTGDVDSNGKVSLKLQSLSFIGTLSVSVHTAPEPVEAPSESEKAVPAHEKGNVEAQKGGPTK